MKQAEILFFEKPETENLGVIIMIDKRKLNTANFKRKELSTSD